MPIFIENEPQLSEGWFKTRAGIPSSSNFSNIITAGGKPSASAKKYMFQLCGEKILGTKEETFSSQAMLTGIERESEARSMYEFMTDSEVKEVGFCFSDEKRNVGCSCDGLVGEDGLVEIKCRKLANHIEYFLNKKIISPAFQQIQGQLLVTGRKWCDYFGYFPGLPPLLIRVERDEVFLAKLKTELKLFCLNLNETINKIK